MKEKEIVFLIRLGSFDGLAQAPIVEHHEQYFFETASTKTGQKGSERVRARTLEGHVNYIRTLKIKLPDQGNAKDAEELEEVCSKEWFDAYKLIAPKGAIKQRYKFPFKAIKVVSPNKTIFLTIPDVYLEVDMYPKQDGDGYHEWARLELELGAIEKEMDKYYKDRGTYDINIKPSLFPFPITQIINPRDAEGEDKLLVDKLYKEVFIFDN